jgi:hypothetical protein
MNSPVSPPPRYLTLAEAIAAVCPPLLEADAQRAIEEALCDGRLVEEQRPIMSAREDFIAAARKGDREWATAKSAGMMAPSPTTPIIWQSRFRDRRVVWATGEVLIPIFTDANRHWNSETPKFSRQSVLALFAAPDAVHPAPGSSAARSDTPAPRRKREVTLRFAVANALRDLYPSRPDHLGLKTVLEAINNKVGRQVSEKTAERALNEVWPRRQTSPNIAKLRSGDI